MFDKFEIELRSAGQKILGSKTGNDYRVFCPDDLCAQFELQGLGTEGDYAFAQAALDMNISVIHSILGKYEAYYDRCEAYWACVKLLGELQERQERDKAIIIRLYKELSDSARAYFNLAEFKRENATE